MIKKLHFSLKKNLLPPIEAPTDIMANTCADLHSTNLQARGAVQPLMPTALGNIKSLLLFTQPARLWIVETGAPG